MEDDDYFHYMHADDGDMTADEQARFMYAYDYDFRDPDMASQMYGGSTGTFNTWSQFAFTFPQCFYPTMHQIIPLMMRTVGMALALRVAVLLRFPPTLVHMLSGGLGILAVWLQFGWPGIRAFVPFEALGYATYRLSPRHRGPVTALFALTYLLTCEAFLYDAVRWHSWRGSLMIVAMKMLSVSFDADGSRLPADLSPVKHVGFCLSSVAVMFGPFMTYQTYEQILQRPPVTFGWIFAMVRLSVISFVCLVVSSCAIPYILTESAHKWALAFSVAGAFHYSHYFVCYLSELCAVAAGLGARQRADGSWSWDGLPVVRMYNVELPRSLVEVVTNWNIAMHVFLKNYVYKPTRHLGQFIAVLATYFASSILHGLNFQLSAVLFSIGVFAYIENGVRYKLAGCLDACIMARACKDGCEHHHKSSRIWVRLINLFFMALAMFHLAYLGVMFDNSQNREMGHSMEHTLSKWRSLDFASHIVAFAFYLLSVLLPTPKKKTA
eukprot:scpid49708/ scgid25038/ Protein-cysteine N-palmitoyltransferase porcupine